MQLGVLGPLVVDDAPVTSPQERRLLAALAARRNRSVDRDVLADILWGDEVPKAAASALHSKVSRLRRRVGPDRLVHSAGTYSLLCEPDECDADRFEAIATRLGPTPGSSDVTVIDDALTLWRGRPFPDLPDDPVAEADAARLEQVRADLEDRRVHALLAAGLTAVAVADAERLTGLHPFHERAWATRMVALVAEGRSVEALRAYQEFRDLLVEETGLEPSSWLGDLEHRILTDPVSVTPAVAPTATTVRPLPAAAPPGSPVTAGGTVWSGKVDPAPPLVGREGELRAADAARAAAADGRPRLVLVTGPFGAGKTRVVGELVGRAVAGGFTAPVCECLEDVRAPLLPLRTLVAALARRAGVDDPIAGLGTQPGDEADERRQGAAVAAADLVLAAARDAPLALVVEDAQWADRTTLDVVAMLAGATAEPGLRLLVVLTHRPAGDAESAAPLARLAREPTATILELGPLNEPDLAELVRVATGARPAPHLVRQLAAATGLSPLLVLTVLRVLGHDGRLRRGPGGLDVDGPIDAEAPDDVTAWVRALTARLEEPSRRLVRLAAVMGEQPPVTHLARTLGVEADDVTALADDAERLGLVRLRDGRVRFTHASYRHAVRSTIRTGERADIDRAIADGLAGLDSEEAVVTRARHLRAGGQGAGDDAAAADAAARAAHVSAAAGQWDDAADLYELAAELDGSTRGAALLGAGAALLRAHDPQAGAARLHEAADAARAAGDLRSWGDAVAELHRLELTLRSGAPAPRTDRAREWLDAAGDAEPDVRARVLGVLAEQAFQDGDLAEGQELADAAVRAARASGDRRVEAEASFAVGLVSLARLDLDTAAARFDASTRVAAADGSPWVATWGACRLPLVQLMAGRLDAARSALTAARALAEPARNWSELSVVEAVAANLSAVADDEDAAGVHVERAERLVLRSGYPFAAPMVHPLAVHLALAAGRPDDAAAALDRWEGLGPGTRAAYGALIAAHCGEAVEAAALPPVERLALRNAFRFVLAAQVGAITGDASRAEQARPGLDRLVELGVRYVPGHPVPVDQLRPP